MTSFSLWVVSDRMAESADTKYQQPSLHDGTCVAARTRPLVSCRRRRLVQPNTVPNLNGKVSGTSTKATSCWKGISGFFYSQLSFRCFCHLTGTEKVCIIAFGFEICAKMLCRCQIAWFILGHRPVCFTLDLLISSLVKTT